MSTAEFTRNGVRLSYTIEGSGQPLVIIHGAASSARSLADCAEILAKRRRVILPDLRGMGKSDRITSLAPTDWVDDVIALLDHLGVDTVDLAGVSLGARIATRIALDHADRVMSLILDAPMVRASGEGEGEVNRIFGPSRDKAMAESLQLWHGDDWEHVAATYLSLRQLPELQTYLDFSATLEQISQPTLITRGDSDDPIHPVSHAAEFHNRINRSSLWIAPYSPFSLARFRPKRWAERVDEFIWSLDLGSRKNHVRNDNDGDKKDD